MKLINRYVESKYSWQDVTLLWYRYTMFKVFRWFRVREKYLGEPRSWWYLSPKKAAAKWEKIFKFWKEEV